MNDKVSKNIQAFTVNELVRKLTDGLTDKVKSKSEVWKSNFIHDSRAIFTQGVELLEDDELNDYFDRASDRIEYVIKKLSK